MKNQSSTALKSQLVLGILGSGQLARMTAMAASELGILTHIYCPESEISPAEQVSSKTTKGSFADKNNILLFCLECDFITLENEFIDQDILNSIDEQFPNRLFPTSKTFQYIGDKISEKEHFLKAGIKVAPFSKVSTIEDISKFANIHGYPIVLKTSKGGYDGYGNSVIHNYNEISSKLLLFKGELLVEAFIAYEKEVAIMIARNKIGEMVVYPIAHTYQENSICHFVHVPALIDNQLEIKIIQYAKQAMEAIDAIGIFAFEFFLTKSGDIYLNESAPRPHNSGHYTIEGVATSQFHNHVRSVCHLPLGVTTLRSPYVKMLNLLGTTNSPAELKNADRFLKITDGHLHLYGKKYSKIGRKMGHFTLLGNNPIEMQQILNNLKSEYSL